MGHYQPSTLTQKQLFKGPLSGAYQPFEWLLSAILHRLPITRIGPSMAAEISAVNDCRYAELQLLAGVNVSLKRGCYCDHGNCST